MAEKIAITVPPDVLRRVETLRHKTRESRSAVFARAARLLLHAEERQRQIQRYVEAYREQPETDADLAHAERLAKTVLASVEWEE